MAVTKAAQKALRQSARRRVRNLKQTRQLKSLLKEVEDLISKKKTKDAEKLLSKVYKELDKAAKNNLIKKNTASRKKSRLSKAIAKAR